MSRVPSTNAFPHVPLWENVPVEARLNVVNPEDFPIKRTLQGLGIGYSPLVETFGIADADELRGRQEVVRYLMGHRKLFEWLTIPHVSVDLPRTETDWLSYFSTNKPHNPFWENVHDFCELLRAKRESLSPRLEQLLTEIDATLPLELEERKWAKGIAETLEQTTVMEGLLVFHVSMERAQVSSARRNVTESGFEYRVSTLDCIKTEDGGWPVSLMHGHQLYSQALADFMPADYPAWSQTWLAQRLGVGGLVERLIDKVNEDNRLQACRSMVITKPSFQVIEDVKNHLRDRLNKLKWDTDALAFGRVHAYVTYSNEGLQVQIVTVEAPRRSGDRARFRFHQFDGYSEDQVAKIKMGREEIDRWIWATESGVASDQIRAAITRQNPDFFEERTRANSSNADQVHRGFALSNVLEAPQFKKRTKTVRSHRKFVVDHIAVLRQVVEVIAELEKVARVRKLPLELPTFVENEHVVSFERLYPVHLLPALEDGQRLCPVNLPTLNGRMIGLTGDHGGGKSVTMITIAEMVYLAQSGLPVYGQEVQLNMKRFLALAFIEQGIHGSVAQRLIEKLANVLRAVRDVDGRQVVVMLDELGSATQEGDGFETGYQLLRKLKELGVSVLFSTQITRLAESAQSSLGAICLKVNRRTHQLTPGIGDGGMSDLRRTSGFDKLLR